MRNSRDHLLDSLLSALVNEWGFEEVYNRINNLEFRTINRTSSTSSDKNLRSYQSKKTPHKLTPRDHVDRLDVPGSKKSILAKIADGFERKEYLENLHEVRNFLSEIGARSASLKQRSDSFKTILNSIKDFPDHKLELILRDLPLYGVSKLGPLSDAIRDASSSIRSSSSEQHDPEKK